jgi:hypothetical protein
LPRIHALQNRSPKWYFPKALNLSERDRPTKKQNVYLDAFIGDLAFREKNHVNHVS